MMVAVKVVMMVELRAERLIVGSAELWVVMMAVMKVLIKAVWTAV